LEVTNHQFRFVIYTLFKIYGSVDLEEELATALLPRISKKCQGLRHFDVGIFRWYKVQMKITKRSTVYFNPGLYKALKFKAAPSDKSLSELINQAVRWSLVEDAEDNEINCI
jgi:hypothetical protein